MTDEQQKAKWALDHWWAGMIVWIVLGTGALLGGAPVVIPWACLIMSQIWSAAGWVVNTLDKRLYRENA